MVGNLAEAASHAAEKEAEEAARAAAVQVYVLTGHCERGKRSADPQTSSQESAQDESPLKDAVCASRALHTNCAECSQSGQNKQGSGVLPILQWSATSPAQRG